MQNIIFYIKKLTLSLIVLVIATRVTHAHDHAHFFRATPWWSEPRLEKPWLTSFDVTIGGGSTCWSRPANQCCNNRSCHGKYTPLFNLYGPHNFHRLGTNVPDKDIYSTEDIILTQLDAVAPRDCFAQVQYTGRFKLVETNIMLIQNFTCGFFAQLHIPVRTFDISGTHNFIDCSPNDAICPNKNSLEWQNFLENFDDILARYDLCINNYRETHPGDISFQAGWTYNYQETTVLDFIDVTLRLGILVPTGHKKNENMPFDIPSGYNGHYGVPVSFDFSCGAYEWLTLGGHVAAIVFDKHTKEVRLKTSADQNGFITLATGQATVSQGPLAHTGLFVKFDHLIGGFSCMLGYSYAQKNKNTLHPCNPELFCPEYNCCNNEYSPWNMHTLNWRAEYDFAKEDHHVAPRLSLHYDRIIGGSGIFNTNITSGSFGIDIVWKF